MTPKSGQFKYWISKLHLVLGMSSGLVVFVVALTGCIYAFQFELRNISQPYRFVEDVGQQPLPPSQLQEIAEKSMPGKQASRIYLYSPERSASILFYDEDTYHFTFINQYSGEILKQKNMHRDFFNIILQLHMHLMLPGMVGEYIVPVATLIFVFMLISGIILWWPKNRAAAKQRFSIKWSARWRRVNYDLHHVLGFYISLIALIMALTGLVWGFSWFEKSVYYVASGGDFLPSYPSYQSDTTQTSGLVSPVDRAFLDVQSKADVPSSFMIFLPATETAPIAIITNSHLDQFRNMEYHFFDQATLKKLDTPSRYGSFEKATLADKIIKMNYDVHTGGIWGLWGKVLAFLVSLLTASLPVTGFLVWKGRKFKKKKKAQKLSSPKWATA